MALDIPLRKTTIGQKSISFLGPKLWSKTNNSLKALKTKATFTHALKKHVLENLIIKDPIFHYYYHFSSLFICLFIYLFIFLEYYYYYKYYYLLFVVSFTPRRTLMEMRVSDSFSRYPCYL